MANTPPQHPTFRLVLTGGSSATVVGDANDTPVTIAKRLDNDGYIEADIGGQTGVVLASRVEAIVSN